MKKHIASFFVVAWLVYLTACGGANGGGGINNGSGQSTVTEVVTNGPTNVLSGGTAQFSAVVQGTNNPSQGVTWSADAGSVIGSGLYQAPNVLHKETHQVCATSVQNPSVKGCTSIDVLPNITVAVNCNPASIYVGQQSQCTATISGGDDPSVTWSATGSGSIDQNGLATSSGAGNVNVVATSKEDPTKSGNFTIAVTNQPVLQSITLSATQSQVNPNGTDQLQVLGNYSSGPPVDLTAQAQYSVVPQYSKDCGNVNSAGLYQAPAVSCVAMITASYGGLESAPLPIIVGIVITSSSPYSFYSENTGTDGMIVTLHGNFAQGDQVQYCNSSISPIIAAAGTTDTIQFLMFIEFGCSKPGRLPFAVTSPDGSIVSNTVYTFLVGTPSKLARNTATGEYYFQGFNNLFALNSSFGIDGTFPPITSSGIGVDPTSGYLGATHSSSITMSFYPAPGSNDYGTADDGAPAMGIGLLDGQACGAQWTKDQIAYVPDITKSVLTIVPGGTGAGSQPWLAAMAKVNGAAVCMVYNRGTGQACSLVLPGFSMQCSAIPDFVPSGQIPREQFGNAGWESAGVGTTLVVLDNYAHQVALVDNSNNTMTIVGVVALDENYSESNVAFNAHNGTAIVSGVGSDQLPHYWIIDFAAKTATALAKTSETAPVGLAVSDDGTTIYAVDADGKTQSISMQ